MGLTRLRAQALKWKVDVNSNLLPGTLLWQFYNRAPKYAKVKWGIQEEKEDHVGMGVYPILEAIGHNARTPTRNKVEEEMTGFLRGFVNVANCLKAEDLPDLYNQAELPDLLGKEGAIKQKLTWPKFKATGATNQGNQGKNLTDKGSAQLSMEPTRTRKYDELNGLYNDEDLKDEMPNIPGHLRQVLVKHANASLSYQTWRAVRGVRRRIQECEVETEVQMEFPWSEEQTNNFTAWCLGKKLREQTIKNYLSKVNKSTTVAV